MTSGGGGGGISVSKYTVAVEECDNGTVTAAPKTAVKVEAGTTVPMPSSCLPER